MGTGKRSENINGSNRDRGQSNRVGCDQDRASARLKVLPSRTSDSGLTFLGALERDAEQNDTDKSSNVDAL